MNKEQIDQMTYLTGLKRGTIMDLLDSGWTYNETIGQTPKWHQVGEEISAGTAGLLTSYKSIVPMTETTAREVVKRMGDVIRSYGFATVGDLLDLVGLRYTFRDSTWGWKTTNGVECRSVRDGWEIRFPDPEVVL